MKAVIFILGILFVTHSNAQKFDCVSKTAAYQELLKTGKTNDAYDIWTDVRKNCPSGNEAIYTDGVQILQYKIDNTSTDEEREKAVRDLLKLYDQYNKNFPSSIPDFEVYKAMALVNNKIDTKEEIFTLLDKGFTKASKNVTDAKAIHTYFSSYTEKFNAGDKRITSNAVLEKYVMVTALLTQLESAHPKNTDYKTAHKAIDNLIKDLATCENLADFYTKSFEANKDNTDWLTSALTSLSGKCSSKPIFLTLAEKLYAVKATPEAANFMGLAYLKQRKFTEAIKFYNEAAELQTNPLEKAKTYYMLATGLLANDLSKSKELLNKAIALDPKMAKAYIFLAQIYANGAKDCGKTDFERKAIGYLAVETVKKAGIAEPHLKPTSDKMANDFAAQSLTAAEISSAKMNGKSLTIGCWINETITFPAK